MSNEREEHIRSCVSALPHSPGVYQFVDKNNTIIYVGKAKSLKRRALGTPLGLVHWKRASSPVEAGTSGFL